MFRNYFVAILVLRRFKIDDTPTANVLVDIAGRASGITAWLLTIVGFGAETSLKVTDKEVSFKSSSISGQTHQVVPLTSVSSTHCGYSKPTGYFIIGVIFLLMGAISLIGPILFGRSGDPFGQGGGFGALLICLVIGGILLLIYFLSKKIVISVETGGGLVLGLSFKRSVIENISVDIEQALKAIHLVNQKVIEAQIK